MSLPTKVIGYSVVEWSKILELSQSTDAKTYINYINKWDWDVISDCKMPTVVKEDGGFISLKKWPHLDINRKSLNKICK